MTYPTAIIEKAKRTERLLQRVSSGESLETMCDELNVTVSEARLAKLLAKYLAGGQTHEAVIDGRCGHPQKVHSGIREAICCLVSTTYLLATAALTPE